MFTDATQRRFDLILVWALGRLTGEGVAATFEYVKRLTSNGVQFVSFTEEHFRTTGPAGEPTGFGTHIVRLDSGHCR